MRKYLLLAFVMFGLFSCQVAYAWEEPRLVDGLWVTSGVTDEQAKQWAAEYQYQQQIAASREIIMGFRDPYIPPFPPYMGRPVPPKPFRKIGNWRELWGTAYHQAPAMRAFPEWMWWSP